LTEVADWGSFVSRYQQRKFTKKFSNRPTAAVSVAAKFAAEICMALSLVAATLFGYGDYGLPADWPIPAVNSPSLPDIPADTQPCRRRFCVGSRAGQA
jgi:hypothetical protein